jgi:hypothetical protein
VTGRAIQVLIVVVVVVVIVLEVDIESQSRTTLYERAIKYSVALRTEEIRKLDSLYGAVLYFQRVPMMWCVLRCSRWCVYV